MRVYTALFIALKGKDIKWRKAEEDEHKQVREMLDFDMSSHLPIIFTDFFCQLSGYMFAQNEIQINKMGLL